MRCLAVEDLCTSHERFLENTRQRIRTDAFRFEDRPPCDLLHAGQGEASGGEGDGGEGTFTLAKTARMWRSGRSELERRRLASAVPGAAGCMAAKLRAVAESDGRAGAQRAVRGALAVRGPGAQQQMVIQRGGTRRRDAATETHFGEAEGLRRHRSNRIPFGLFRRHRAVGDRIVNHKYPVCVGQLSSPGIRTPRRLGEVQRLEIPV